MFGQLIQGSSFRLRPPREEDAGTMATWFEDQEVTAWLSLRFPPSLADELRWLSSVATSGDTILWVIEHEGRPVGTTAIAMIDWQNLRGSTGTLIGDKAAWGKGIAGEMMRLRADYAFTTLPLHKLKSGYIDGNVASGRAQAAAGYREVGRLRQEHYRHGRWHDFIVTELMRADWEQARRPVV